MKLENLKSGELYTYQYKEISETVEFSRLSNDNTKAIVHPPGENNMQDSFIVDPQYLKEDKVKSFDETVFMLEQLIRNIVREEIVNNLHFEEETSIDYGAIYRSISLNFGKQSVSSFAFHTDK